MLFTSEMVRAIIDGRKTETRRLSGLEAVNFAPDRYHLGSCNEQQYSFHGESRVFTEIVGVKYRPGDEIWVKETFYPTIDGGLIFRADEDDDSAPLWKPSIFMPRKFSRITLTVKSERVERLQEITEEGAISEGIKTFTKDGTLKKHCVGDYGEKGNVPWAEMPRSPISAYALLWGSINPNFNWEYNPWVRVIKFEVK